MRAEIARRVFSIKLCQFSADRRRPHSAAQAGSLKELIRPCAADTGTCRVHRCTIQAYPPIRKKPPVGCACSTRLPSCAICHARSTFPADSCPYPGVPARGRGLGNCNVEGARRVYGTLILGLRGNSDKTRSATRGSGARHTANAPIIADQAADPRTCAQLYAISNAGPWGMHEATARRYHYSVTIAARYRDRRVQRRCATRVGDCRRRSCLWYGDIHRAQLAQLLRRSKHASPVCAIRVLNMHTERKQCYPVRAHYAYLNALADAIYRDRGGKVERQNTNAGGKHPRTNWLRRPRR